MRCLPRAFIAVDRAARSLEPGRRQVLVPLHRRERSAAKTAKSARLERRAGAARRTGGYALPGRLSRVDGIDRHSTARRALGADTAAAEERHQLLEHLSMRPRAGRPEDRVELPTTCAPHHASCDGSTRRSSPRRRRSRRPMRHRAEHRLGRSFLLIVRTGRIFTAHVHHPKNRV